MVLRLIVYNILLLDAMNAHNQPDLGRRATNTASQLALHSERRALHAEEHRSDANQRRRLANAVGQPGPNADKQAERQAANQTRREANAARQAEGNPARQAAEAVDLSAS